MFYSRIYSHNLKKGGYNAKKRRDERVSGNARIYIESSGRKKGDGRIGLKKEGKALRGVNVYREEKEREKGYV